MWGGSFAPDDYINFVLVLHFVLIPGLTFTISCVLGWFHYRVGVAFYLGILMAIISVALSLVIGIQGSERGYVVDYFDGGGYLDLVPAALVTVFLCCLFVHILLHTINKIAQHRAVHKTLHGEGRQPEE